MKSYENYKHIKTFKSSDTLKNFYFDAFNSIKHNQYELTRYKTNVSNKIFIIKYYREDIYENQKIIKLFPEPVAKDNKPDFLYTSRGYFKRPVAEKTYDRIFNAKKRKRI